MTESGKTTLARGLAACIKSEGYGVLVLDPLRDPRWTADFIADDPDVFLDVFWRSRCCHVFIDGEGEGVGRYDPAMLRTATRGRHWGHSCYFLAQRATLVAPVVRDQCRHLYLFTLATADAETLAKEWNRSELCEASTLRQGEFFHCSRYGELTRGALFGAPRAAHAPRDERTASWRPRGRSARADVPGPRKIDAHGTEGNTRNDADTHTGTDTHPDTDGRSA